MPTGECTSYDEALSHPFGAGREAYIEFASFYDAFHMAHKDYDAEARRVIELVIGRTGVEGVGGLSLLDVACGTGLHLQSLRRMFGQIEGTDLSAEMLSVAEKRLPGIRLTRSDMSALDIRGDGGAAYPEFDVVTCLFGGIGFLTDEAQLRSALQRMAAHLKVGGVLVIEPWLTPESFQD